MFMTCYGVPNAGRSCLCTPQLQRSTKVVGSWPAVIEKCTTSTAEMERRSQKWRICLLFSSLGTKWATLAVLGLCKPIARCVCLVLCLLQLSPPSMQLLQCCHLCKCYLVLLYPHRHLSQCRVTISAINMMMLRECPQPGVLKSTAARHRLRKHVLSAPLN